MCFDVRKLLRLEDMFDAGELRKMLTEGFKMSGSTQTHTLTVRKPFCCPAQKIVHDALQPYGVRVLGFSENGVQLNIRDFARMMKTELRTFENLKYGPAAVMWLPLAIEANVTVAKAQASWAEYLLERTGRLIVVGGRVNEKNRQWADRHNGKMPTPWADDTAQRLRAIDAQIQVGIAQGQPWIESGCKSGHGVWQAANQAIQKQQEDKNVRKR